MNHSIKPKLINQMLKYTNYLVIENNPLTVDQIKEAKHTEKANALKQKQRNITVKIVEEKMKERRF